MPIGTKGTRLSLAILAVALVTTVWVATHGVGVATAAHETGDHPDWIHEANQTVRLSSNQPGASASLTTWASIPEGDEDDHGKGYWNVSFAGNWAPKAFSDANGESTCDRQDMRTAGVDRGANNSGTQIDESTISNAKNFWIETNDAGQTYILTELYDRNDIGGPHLSLNYTDEVIVKTNECFVNPQQTGWYRIGSYLNGTNWDGEFVEGAGLSMYTYICNCTNRTDAIETLGPPPVRGYGHEGSRIYKEPHELDGHHPAEYPLSEPREPGEYQSTSPTPTPATTPTPTETVAGTAIPTETTATQVTQTPTPTPAETTEPKGTTTTAGGPGGPNTPTADAPGFTSIVGLLALLLASVFLRRR